MKKITVLLFWLLATQLTIVSAQKPYILILGTAQDGGYPQAGCNKICCKNAWANFENRKHVASIAIINPKNKTSYIIDATPNFSDQLQILRNHLKDSTHLPSGIFITHAHIGHYTGLMQLGREVMGLQNMPVYVMPKMKNYLENNGPWSQLVKLKNVKLIKLQNHQNLLLDAELSISPFTVPHRDEYSETVGFTVLFGSKKLTYIPDIDKWQTYFETNKDDELAKKFELEFLLPNDYVLIDGTFYKDGEIARNIKEVPHPFITETTRILQQSTYKHKIYFTHFNHTNPINYNIAEVEALIKLGFNVAKEGLILQ